MKRKRNAKQRETDNETKPGPAAETHGILPNTRDETHDPSQPMLSAVPHPPPEFRPTEPLRHAVIPQAPNATGSHPLDFTLPHMLNPGMQRRDERPVKANPLILNAALSHGPAAQDVATSGDNRHEILGGGIGNHRIVTNPPGQSPGDYVAYHDKNGSQHLLPVLERDRAEADQIKKNQQGGATRTFKLPDMQANDSIHHMPANPHMPNHNAPQHAESKSDGWQPVDWHRGSGLRHGENCSGEMEGGTSASRIGWGIASLGITEGARADEKHTQHVADRKAQRAYDQKQQHTKAEQIRAIPADFQAPPAAPKQGGKQSRNDKFLNVVTLGAHGADKKYHEHRAQVFNDQATIAQGSDRLAAYQAYQKQQAQQAKQAAQKAKAQAQQQAKAAAKAKSKVPQPTAPVNNAPIAPGVNVQQKDAIGGKSKFWRDFAHNLSGIALNASKIAAKNAESFESEAGALGAKGKKKGGKKMSAANFIGYTLLGQNPYSKEMQKFAPEIIELA